MECSSLERNEMSRRQVRDKRRSRVTMTRLISNIKASALYYQKREDKLLKGFQYQNDTTGCVYRQG